MRNLQLWCYCTAMMAVAVLFPIISTAQSKTEFIHPDDLPCKAVFSLVTDAGGQVFGYGVKYAPNGRTEIVSIMRFKGLVAERINTPERGYPISDTIRIEYFLPDVRRGVLWASAKGGLLYFNGEQWGMVNYTDSLMSLDTAGTEVIHMYKNMAIDSTGALLVSDEVLVPERYIPGLPWSYRGYYRLLRYDGQSWQILLDGYSDKKGRKFPRIGSITVMPNGAIWVYYAQIPTEEKSGLARIQNGSVEVFDNIWCWQNKHPNIKGGGILSAGKDFLSGKDFLWVYNSPDDAGFDGVIGGVSKFYPDENRWRHFTDADGFPMDKDSSLKLKCFYDAGDEQWFGGRIGGAYGYNGVKAKHFTTRQPVNSATNGVNTITKDKHGRIWCGTGYGIVILTDGLTDVVDRSMQEQRIEIFPNPAAESFTIHCPEGAEVTIRDVLGNDKMMSSGISNGMATFSTIGLASGIYFVEILGTDGTVSLGKVLVNR